VKKHQLAFGLPLFACAAEAPGGSDDAADGITITASVSATGGADDDPSVSDTGAASADGTADDGPDTPKFDVANAGFCEMRDAGVYCTDDGIAIECGAAHDEVSTENCNPDICLAGTGCVVCLAGQYTCMAEKVMVCNDAANPPAWQLQEVCDPAAGEGCDLSIPGCAVLQPVGTNVPTGYYYQFADFHTGVTPFTGGYDVDSFEDKLYVLNYSNAIDVYQVELTDGDGDGQLEPNQHPDNPEMPGAIEPRILTYLETIPTFGTPSLSSSELFALEDRIYIGGSQITENVLGVGTSVVTAAPPWASYFAQIGYDEVYGVWYGSNESQRRVMQYDPNTMTWGIAFLYPVLDGDHMDGMEVVTDPNTGTPYVYVSDMTSDFIGQYRFDTDDGWVQHNLFQYQGTPNIVLEGMGFGALNHFWATAGESVYEIGGGDLSDFTDPPG
jgi:hypothetical protein